MKNGSKVVGFYVSNENRQWFQQRHFNKTDIWNNKWTTCLYAHTLTLSCSKQKILRTRFPENLLKEFARKRLALHFAGYLLGLFYLKKVYQEVLLLKISVLIGFLQKKGARKLCCALFVQLLLIFSFFELCSASN